jgi:hypothetical protein
VLTGLGCASCGGSLEVREGHTNLRCQYCGTSLAVVGRRGVVRLMVLARVDREQAEGAVARWFGSSLRKEPALAREATIEEMLLAWFPFIRVRADIVGWLLGTRAERRKRGSTWETVERPVEHQVDEAVDLTLPAAEMAELGVQRVDLRGDALVPLDEPRLRDLGMVFQPAVAVETAAEAALGEALARVRSGSRLHRVTFSWLATVRRRVSLVYYPMWIIRYGFRGRTYQVLVDAEDGSIAYGKAPGNNLYRVDAEDGSIAYGKAPGNNLYRAASLVAACGTATFIGTSLVQHLGWLLRQESGLAALGIAGLVLAGVVGWGYGQFRHGGVVEEGTGVAVGRGPARLTAVIRKVLE